jgi:predicted DsbA family dithiol-disulfide isomerase
MDFELTFDYLCPFARNACEAVLAALDEDIDINPRFRPFSLTQVHVEVGGRPVWDEPDGKSGLLALQWGVAAREHQPEVFAAAHRALFAARHDLGLDIGDPGVVREAVGSAGADVELIAEAVASGTPLKLIADEHTEAVERWGVFGVPTFIVGDEAVYVRLMERSRVDDLDRVLGMIEWTRLNEFKRTRIPR